MRNCLFFFIFITTSCGKDEFFGDWNKTFNSGSYPEVVNQEEPIAVLKEILQSFEKDCKDIYNVDLSNLSKLQFIRYGDPATKEKPSTVGICNTWYEDDLLIKSNIIVKDLKSPILNKALLYHELGHCVLELDHTSQESKTIMSPTMLNVSHYSNNWDKLVKDLCLRYR